jgi:flavin-dependent dehydrogenase
MEMDAAPEVLVVGAGPVGLTMAAELARHGARCRIIEASPAPATTSRAIVIHARTLELFAAMGIADRVVAAGQKIHALRMHADGRAVFRLSLDPLETPYAFILGLRQAEGQVTAAPEGARLVPGPRRPPFHGRSSRDNRPPDRSARAAITNAAL